MEVPIRQQRNTDLLVQWSEIDYRYPQYLFIQYYKKSVGFASDGQYKTIIRYPYVGKFKVNKKYITYVERQSSVLYSHRIILQAQTTGALYMNFLPGGSITCNFNIYQNIEVY